MLLLAGVLWLSVTGVPALAQSFNIDLGSPASPFGPPPSTYGGAASQSGFWNAMSPLTPTILAKLDGTMGFAKIIPSGVGISASSFQNPATGGDDEALMDDGVRIVGDVGVYTVQINGLMNGAYQVYTYAMAPDIPDGSVVTIQNATIGPQTCGGTWPGAHVQGTTYTRHVINVVNGSLNIQVRPNLLNGFANGIQIVRAAEAFAPYCFGTVAACPCANAGAPDSGCENSFLTGGGKLVATGTAWISSDSVVLQATHLPLAAPALFFQGTTAISPAFGDGVRCVGGTITRLGAKTATAGACSYPTAGDPAVSVKGQVVGGGVRRYQVWYRNAAAFCTSSTFNLTNGLSVLWQP
jgi:hypothetical protein